MRKLKSPSKSKVVVVSMIVDICPKLEKFVIDFPLRKSLIPYFFFQAVSNLYEYYDLLLFYLFQINCINIVLISSLD